VRIERKEVQRGYRTYWLKECLNCGKSIKSYNDDKIFCNMTCANTRRQTTYNLYGEDIQHLLLICLEQMNMNNKNIFLEP